MTDSTWRPLGVDSDETIAAFEVLHEGIPAWMSDAYWVWIRDSLSQSSDGIQMPRSAFVAELAQVLKIPMPNLQWSAATFTRSRDLRDAMMRALQKHPDPVQVADYILAHRQSPAAASLDGILTRSKSAWTVGERYGKTGLVRRVPEGVQLSAEVVSARAGRAGSQLAKAWNALHSPDADFSLAYRTAILAVEDAAIPVVSPKNSTATLGTVLKQIEDQGDWALPMTREHPNAPTSSLIVASIRVLWHGQHDRHGGQPTQPGDVSREEATVAVSLAVSLVHWFSAGLVARAGKPTGAA